jgi:hypothetical protein
VSPTYAQWIAAHVPADPTGTCREVTAAMGAAFPELKRARGYYLGAGMERRWPHWWLVTADGTIVDPTAAQWPDHGRGFYAERDESEPEPTGKCSNCGEYCYEGRSPCCSEACDREYHAYIMGSARG